MEGNNKQQLVKTLGVSFITSLLASIYFAIGTGIPAFTLYWWVLMIAGPLILFLLVYLVVSNSLWHHFGALWAQQSKGKFRGLWRDKELDEQLIKQFTNASEIKMKVTRAYNLFANPSNANFFRCINNDKLLKQDRNIKLLMHPPCLKSKHIKRRADANRMAPEDFLETWFDVLESLLININTNRNNRLTTEIRFYASEHDRWRFYIFDGKDEVLFANYYDTTLSGYQTPMYKVHHSNESLHRHLSHYFDEVWGSDEESMDACGFLLDHYAQTNNTLTECVGCLFQNTCSNVRKENLDRIHRARQSNK